MPAGKIHRFVGVAVFLIVATIAPSALADDPEPGEVLLDFPVAAAETQDENESQAVVNVTTAANIICDITPRDVVSPSGPTFYGVGVGTSEVTVNRLTSHATDDGNFEAVCVRRPEDDDPAAPFTMMVAYNFQYKVSALSWPYTGGGMSCEANSQAVNQDQVAVLQVPGRDCSFERIYQEDGPVSRLQPQGGNSPHDQC